LSAVGSVGEKSGRAGKVEAGRRREARREGEGDAFEPSKEPVVPVKLLNTVSARAGAQTSGATAATTSKADLTFRVSLCMSATP
jgi:hypothetical protein